MAMSRTALRSAAKLPLRRTPARFESTASKATEAAKDTASKASNTAAEYKSKASEGLSRVSSAAGPAISGAAKGLGNALGKIGGRTGRFISFVEREYHLGVVVGDLPDVFERPMADSCDRTNSSRGLLCASWVGAFKIGFPGTEDEPSVSLTHLVTM